MIHIRVGYLGGLGHRNKDLSRLGPTSALRVGTWLPCVTCGCGAPSEAAGPLRPREDRARSCAHGRRVFPHRLGGGCHHRRRRRSCARALSTEARMLFPGPFAGVRCASCFHGSVRLCWAGATSMLPAASRPSSLLCPSWCLKEPSLWLQFSTCSCTWPPNLSAAQCKNDAATSLLHKEGGLVAGCRPYQDSTRQWSVPGAPLGGLPLT